MLASRDTEWLTARSVKYLVSAGGNTVILPLPLLCPRIDLRRRSKKAQSIPNFYFLIVTDFPIGTTRHNLEEIAIRAYWGGRHMTQLQSRHVLHRNRVMRPIDLDFEVVVKFLVVFWVLIILLFISHRILLVVVWYHDTTIL